MLEVMLPVERDHGHFVFVQEQEASVTIDHGFLCRLLPIGDDPAKACHDFVAHGDEPFTVLGLGVLDDVLHLPGAL